MQAIQGIVAQPRATHVSINKDRTEARRTPLGPKGLLRGSATETQKRCGSQSRHREASLSNVSFVFLS